MKVSVVINSYTLDRYEDYDEAIRAVLEQTYDPVELVLVSDGNEALYERVDAEYGDRDDVITHCTDENVGNSASRTIGGQLATGDVVAVTDDDARPEPDWVEELVRVYEETDAIAVGGIVVPEWVDGEPDHLPEEFYWLIGCNHRGFGEHMDEVRNTFGCNLSFKKAVFDDLGGFSPHVGRIGDKQIQGHETEICARMRKRYGTGVIYTTDAVVHHKIYDYRLGYRWLIERSFWQGYSKRVMKQLLPDASGGEGEYLRTLLTRFVPSRIGSLVRSPSIPKLTQLVMIFVFTAAVGFGYLYGMTQGNLIDDDVDAATHSARS